MYQWSTSLLLSVAAVTMVGVWLWSQNKKRTFVKVGKVAKLLFYPVKSLKALEVDHGTCTKLGFVVNNFLERSFMLISKENFLVSQRDAPLLVLLTPRVTDNYLTISGPDVEELKIEIKHKINKSDKIVTCRVHADSVQAVDCGDSASAWFEKYIDMPGVRFVQFFPELPAREYTLTNAFRKKSRKENPAGFQDLTAIHLLSKPSVDDLNSRIENESEKISELNFRPNVLADGCNPYDEDSWKFVKFTSGAELSIVMLTDRCLLTTNNPETAVLSQKEPLVTLRKYRVPKNPKIAKLVHNIPCLGVNYGVTNDGEVRVGDDIYAVVEDFDI